MTTHELKTWPDSFQAIWKGAKRAEFRRNDRDFHVGDLLVLREYDPGTGRYSGFSLTARITHMSPASLCGIPSLHGIPEGYAVLSIELVDEEVRRLVENLNA